MKRAWLLVLGAGLVAASRGAAQPDSAASMARRASVHIRAGRFDSAQVAYSRMLLSARSRGDSAEALFGNAYARQQVADLNKSAELETIVAGYQQAGRLDAGLFGRAQYNIATAYSVAGRHRAAAAAYVDAIPALDSLRASLELRAGREYLAAGDPERAAPLLASAARSADTRSEAQAALLALYLRAHRMDSVVVLARSLEGSAAPRTTASAALLASMADPEWAKTKWAEECLVLLARNYAVMDLGPAYFGSSQRAGTDSAITAVRGTPLEGALTALRNVYAARKPGSVFLQDPAGSWWLATTERHAVWSSTLRSLGEWYDRAGDGRVAISFYEAAIGLPGALDMLAPWLDLQALPPLAALYATMPDARNREMVTRIQLFSKAVFVGKADAYAEEDWEHIRPFHLTLATLYALQGKWDGGVTGGIFQVEHLRTATNMLRQRTGIELHDPPKLLELLALEYRRRGCAVQGRPVAAEARDEYRRVAAMEDAERMDQLWKQFQKAPPAPSSAACSGNGG